MVEKQVMEEIDPDIEGEEYFRNSDDMEEHWKEGEEQDNQERYKVHAQIWEKYTKENKELIKKDFLLAVPHPKRGGIVWTCVEDNVVG